MTSEEAKLVLDNARPQTKEIDRQFYDDEDLNNALDMAIKALEQQPNDFVPLEVYKQVTSERDIAIEQLRELGYSFGEKIRTSDDCVSRQAVIDLIDPCYANCGTLGGLANCIEEMVKELPPVTPTHRMCKDCTKSNILNGFEGYSIVCSRFGRMAVNPDFYCADFEKRGSENEVD